MPKTLAMLKMEKNFIAHNEKHYPRQPYLTYTIGQLIERVEEEVEELIEAYEQLSPFEAKKECADISNLIDYIFEALTIKEQQQ